MNRALLAPYGLKWNPFSTELPSEALYLSPKINDFFWRIENVHVREGGFALIQGDPGTGKSVVLRALAERLERQTELTVGVLNHPQSNLGDFYRELAEVRSGSGCLNSIPRFISGVRAGCERCSVVHGGVRHWRAPSRSGQRGAHHGLHVTRPAPAAALPRGTFRWA
jgi:energy-coupling factor transporter ATP-binding protein EcfA2